MKTLVSEKKSNSYFKKISKKFGESKTKTCKQVQKELRKVLNNSNTTCLLKPTSSSVFLCESVNEKCVSGPKNSQVSTLIPTVKSSVKQKSRQTNSGQRKLSKTKPVNEFAPSVIKFTSCHVTDNARVLKAHFTVKSDEDRGTCDAILSPVLSVEKYGLANVSSSTTINSLITKNCSTPLKTSTPGNSLLPEIEERNLINSKNDSPESCSSSVNDSATKINIYKLNCSNFLLRMELNSSLYFIGVIEIELLKGSVEVFGYEIKKLHRKCLLYSLQGSSNLSFKAKSSNSDGSDEHNLMERLISLGLSETDANTVLKDENKIVLCLIRRSTKHKSSTVWPLFIESNLSYPLFPTEEMLNKESRIFHKIEYEMGCIFDESLQYLGFKEFSEIPEWSLIERDIMEDKKVPRVVLCGGKSVGKSTLLSWLVNKSLARWGRVLVIDCDLGQCEFTPPGCVSVTLVTAPLFGPNYTHLTEPLRCVYLGEVDVTKCPESYIQGIQELVRYAGHEQPTLPWLVNTMGFTKGFGVTVACGIVKAVGPTHVVQIESRDRKMNFPAPLAPELVWGQQTGALGAHYEALQYKLYTVPSAAEVATQKARGLSPPEARSLVILSYLSDMLSVDTPCLSHVTPYTVSLEDVELRTTSEHSLTEEQVAAAMNGNLVALCEEQDSFTNCLGFGVVRGVDRCANTLYLITPLPPTSLARVNCLVKGNTALPESLYLQQLGVVGRLPYLAFTSGGPTTRFAKRDFRNNPPTR